ncbi:Cj0814 family flagellar-dependent secreted protein, partial [Campylobacter estrildidarum]
MINSINSYSNYNYYTNTLNSKKNSKTNDLVDNKEINNNTNSNNNISNNTSLNQIKQTNSNLVSDKSQAIDKILGYGVDEDGFFTSDFNEAAGIPKDYKIYAKDMESFANFISEKNSVNNAFFTNVNIAKTIGNAYKVFSQLISSENTYFTKDELENIPKWLQYNSRNFQITHIYSSKDDFMNVQKYENNFTVETSLKIDFKDKQNISKGEALLAFAKGLEQNYGIVEGDTTVLGKLGGLDRNMSLDEIKDLKNFFDKHPINHTNNDEVMRQILLLPMQINNIEEFKKEWLELEADNKKSLQKEETSQDIESQKIFNSIDTDQKTIKKTKPFKPIQAESKNKETYKDDNIRNELIKKLLENK